MEEQWIVDRAKLHRLMLEKPDWTNYQYAEACGRCKSWVKKGHWIAKGRKRAVRCFRKCPFCEANMLN